MALSRHALPVPAGLLPLTVARGGGSGAALVVVPSAFGVAPDLEAQLEALAGEARLVATFDPFFREDPGVVPYEDMARVMQRLRGLDRARAQADLRAVLAWARAEAGGGPVVVLGVCFGGPFALLAAADGLVDGVATWHGTRLESFLGRAPEMRCPMRLHFGGVDPFVPPAAVEAVREAFAGREDVHLFVHPGATHGFTHPGAAKAYDARAERAALASVCELVRAVQG
jgi:carboxymethylenebutenolidase